jgi:hypothetical protein
LEALPSEDLLDILSRGIGWLSPLGQSEWDVTPTVAEVGDNVTYQLILRSNDIIATSVAIEHYVPEGQLLRFPTLPSEFIYNASEGRINWNGMISSGMALTYTWNTKVTSLPQKTIHPTVSIVLPNWDLQFARSTQFHGSGLDLDSSFWIPTNEIRLTTGSVYTGTLLMQNSSDYTETVNASIWLMEGLMPVTATDALTERTHGWYMNWWEGLIGPRQTVTLSVPIYTWLWDGPVRMDAMLSDSRGGYWEKSHWMHMIPWNFFLPVVIR